MKLFNKNQNKVSVDQKLIDNDIILSVRHLKKYFSLGKGLKKEKLKAVHDVSFDIKRGEVFGIVGESGCGKSTTGRTIIGLEKATSGSIYLNGKRIIAGNRWNEKEIKWVTIRGKKKIKELKKQCKYEIADFSKMTTPDETSIKQIKEKYNLLIKEVKNNIKTTKEVQKAKIRQHKYDVRHAKKSDKMKIQMIFQDPIDSLDPRMTVYDIIAEGLKIEHYGLKNEKKLKAELEEKISDLTLKSNQECIENPSEANEIKAKLEKDISILKQETDTKIKDGYDYHKMVAQMLEKVGLIPDYASRYPHEFSGGQRQRIGIARALIMKPELVIADEPISGLDVSIRAQIINLLNDLRESMGLTVIFIAHDLSVVKYFCNRIAVMYYGNLVELTSSNELFKHPLHPYTKSLLSAIPKPDPLFEKTRKRISYNSQVHDYSTDKPVLQEVYQGHFVLSNKAELEKYKQEVEQENKLLAEKENKEVKEEKPSLETEENLELKESEDDSNIYYLVKNPKTKKWGVRLSKTGRTIKNFDLKVDARKYAKELAKKFNREVKE